MSLSAIFDALAAMSVSVGTVTPDVLNLDEQKNGIETADLPVRLMLLSSSNRSEGTSYEYMSIQQNVANIRWRLADLLLWDAQGQEQGLHDQDPDLATYMSNYATALLDFGGPTVMWRLEDARFRPGIYEWPSNSDHWFFGVLCELDVLEVDP